MSREADGLAARIRRIRRAIVTPDVIAQLQPAVAGQSEPTVDDLQRRVVHLEQLVQGLQDSVYRESQRHDRRVAELEARLEPATLAAELSRDARNRGL
jgi:hypothetical protein